MKMSLGRRQAPRLIVTLLVCALLGGVVGFVGWRMTSGGDAVMPDPPAAETPSEEPPVVQEEPPKVKLARPTKPLAAGVAKAGADLHWQFHTYVVFRMVELSFAQREPLRFDGWIAYDDFEADEASPEGLLTQWDPGWYITHEWSEYGKQILQLIPGDIVCVNGTDIRVEGAFDYPKDSYNSEINEVVDMSYIVFQTCEPNSNLNRIVYGTVIDE